MRPIVWCGIGVCAGIYLFFRGFILLQRRRLILDTPSSKIRSAALGMVEISGLAVGPYTMAAPITTRPCYYYRTLVWEWKRSGRSRQWVKVAAESMHLPFFLDDNTGRMLIDPRGAELDLHGDFQQQFCDSFFTTKDPVPENVRSFLSRHGIVASNKIKVEEFCIKPKNSLFVLGTLAENPGLEVTPEPVQDTEATTSLRDALSFQWGESSFSLGPSGGSNFDNTVPADLLLVRASQSSPEVIRLSTGASSTKPADMTQQQRIAAALKKAGIANPAAWAAAGIADPAMQVSASPVTVSPNLEGVSPGNGAHPEGQQDRSNGFETRPPVVLMKGANDKTFLISWRSQQDVARSLGWKCTLMIWGGPAIALLCLYFLLSLTHLL
ncbi:MAG: GIDE domain-containing protein [Candidatus Sulfotelmatobacter sp.]